MWDLQAKHNDFRINTISGKKKLKDADVIPHSKWQIADANGPLFWYSHEPHHMTGIVM